MAKAFKRYFTSDDVDKTRKKNFSGGYRFTPAAVYILYAARVYFNAKYTHNDTGFRYLT